MANKYNINLFKDIFFLFEPLPISLNLLDNFRRIYYRGSISPRIFLGPNNQKNLEEIFYSPIEDINYNIFNNNEYKMDNNISNNINNNKINNDDIKINLSNEINKKNLLNSKEQNESNKNNKKINFIEKKDFNKKKNRKYTIEKLEQLNILSQDKKSIEPIPPKRIISIINADNNNINNNQNNIKNINNIILNNINLISNYNCNFNNIMIQNNKNHSPTIINQINNQTIFNFNFNIFTNKNKDFSNNMNLSSKNNDSQDIIISKPLFEISSEANLEKGKKHIKRGRKILTVSKNNRVHSASDDDNLLRKIQVHYLTFIINFVNDVIKTLINNKFPPLFKNLDYAIKKTVKHEYVEKLKMKNIGQILQMSVSPKMKIHGDIVNKKIYERVCTICPFMIYFLQKNYVEFFKDYYFNNNKIFQENGKMIQLSIKTKTFKNLVEKNENLKDKLKYIAIRYFINTPKRYKKS